MSLRLHALVHSSPINLEFFVRAAVVAVFVTTTHQLQWYWLCFLTSEAVLRGLSSMGMAADRISFDTILFSEQLVKYTVSCTFIDVVIGAIPFLYDRGAPLLKESIRLSAIASLFFTMNLARLLSAQLLYGLGLPWAISDGVLGGFSYFAVWVFIWRYRTWQ